MKLTLFSVVFLAVPSLCFAQGKLSSSDQSQNETTIVNLEKGTWETYKNKQADAFKKYLAADYKGVYDDAIDTIDAEAAAMATTELRSYSFTDTKVSFPKPDIAVITCKTVLEQTVKGKDESGTYNSGSVWVRQNGKWLTIFHTDVKAKSSAP
jgi:hypothetical protein